jgi:GT2 family glycosyltransferase
MQLRADYYYPLKYWSRKLKKRPYRFKFLVTKAIEITSNTLHRGPIVPAPMDDDVLPEFSFQHNGIMTAEPHVTVIVPVFIRTQVHITRLNNLIRSIEQLNYKKLDFIFVDDCSPTAYHLPSHITHIRLAENKGPATARNRGIEEALKSECDIIAFTDSDCVLDKDWITSIATSFYTNKNVHALSGNTLSYNKCWLGDYHNINGTLNGRLFRYSDYLLYGATCNFATTRTLIEQIRFEPAFASPAAEDLEFSFRIIKAGFNIGFQEDMVVYHDYGYTGNPVNDLPIFWKQFARYGEGEKKLIALLPYYYDYLDTSDGIESIQ